MEAIATAHPLAQADGSPPLLETYALLYAFTLVWLAASVAGLAFWPLYSNAAGYTAVIAAPPVLGIVSLMLTDRPLAGWRSLLVRTGLLVVLGVAGSVTVMFVGMLFLPLVTGGLADHLAAFGPVWIAGFLVVAAPLVPVLLRVSRRGEWVRAAVLVIALALVAVALYLTVAPGAPLLGLLRKDQASFLFGGLTWYIPALGVAGAVCRRIGFA
ncbi:MAG: hypothetical protein Q7W30_07615 [Coriobacteriia bacterium]|nr:hypothetical protein [Coriobacteriia bacterium]